MRVVQKRIVALVANSLCVRVLTPASDGSLTPPDRMRGEYNTRKVVGTKIGDRHRKDMIVVGHVLGVGFDFAGGSYLNSG